MRRTIGYVVAPVVVGLLVLLVASGCSKQQAHKISSPKTQAVVKYPELSYADLTKKAQDFEAKFKAQTANVPANVKVPEPSLSFLGGFSLKDSGTVLSTGQVGGRWTANIDLNGDGQPELTLNIPGKSLPAGVTSGAKVAVTCSIGSPSMSGGRLTFTGNSKSLKVVGGGS